LEVVVYSRHDAVQLYLNDKLLGQQPTGRAQEFETTFRIPYAPGELRVESVHLTKPAPGGGLLEALAPNLTLPPTIPGEKLSLTTAGDAAKIALTPDRKELAADGQDLSFVTVEITDAEGRWRPDAAVPVEFKLTGPGEIAGIGSADLASRESYQANPRSTYQGRALIVIRTTSAPGEITLAASSPNLTAEAITLKSIAPQ
jgi:beta-galactosidase